MSENYFRTETISVKGLDGMWRLVAWEFLTDANDNFRTLYPARMDFGPAKLEFLKVSKSGRTLYKEVT